MFEDELLKEETDAYMLFEDYTYRKIKLYRRVFDRYTQGKYVQQERRHQLFEHIKDVLQDPHELWMNTVTDERTDLVQSRYIRFYSDTTLVVDVLLGEGNRWIMREWYEFDETKMKETELRKGVLIMSKAME